MDDVDLAQALKEALAAAGPAWQHQPSILRRRLEHVLAHDAPRHRGRIHQLVVAADEKVPGRLVQKGGDREHRNELATSLAATRGWGLWAADWAVTTWAFALGLTTDLASYEQPSEIPTAARTELPGTELPGTELPPSGRTR